MRVVFGLLAACAALAAPAPARAELPPDPVGVSETLPAPGPHWAFSLDFQLPTFNGRYVLFDADDADFLAHLSAGQFPSLAIAPDASELYVAETTYQYGSRGQRYDFVTVYDTTHYAPQEPIALPTGKRALMASLRRMTLLGDPRFLAIYNYTPASSVSIVDVEQRRHLGETPSPGCHLLFPTGKRSVTMLCGDGATLTLSFDEQGQFVGRHRSEPFFDPDADPLKTNAARIGATWYFVSYAGNAHPVDLSGETPAFDRPWPLVDHDAKPAGWFRALLSMGKAGPWKPGGMQLAAGHTGRGELYVIVHPVLWSGGVGDHDFPGPEVWVYDVERRERVRRIALRGVAVSINVTQDPEPLLLVSGADIDTEALRLEVYDAVTGRFLREMFEFGSTAFGLEPVLGPKSGGAR